MRSDPSPTREPTAIQNPEPPIGIPQPWPSVPTPKDQQLLPQVKVLHWVFDPARRPGTHSESERAPTGGPVKMSAVRTKRQ
jgi:hypothetical protein